MTEELNLNKASGLQMTMKAINNIAGLDELISTLLVYDVYSRMTRNDVSISTIAQRAAVLEKVMIVMTGAIALSRINWPKGTILKLPTSVAIVLYMPPIRWGLT
jgi:hypothetical protein